MTGTERRTAALAWHLKPDDLLQGNGHPATLGLRLARLSDISLKTSTLKAATAHTHISLGFRKAGDGGKQEASPARFSLSWHVTQ